jgi:hypothetical protein
VQYIPDSGPVPQDRTPVGDLYLHVSPGTRLGVDDTPSTFGIFAITLFGFHVAQQYRYCCLSQGVRCPPLPSLMNSQHAATTQRPKSWLSMLNASEPHGLPTFHIVNTGIHPFRHRPKSPMSLIVSLPRGSVVRTRENPPPLFPESFFTRPALVTANVFCAHTSKAGRLGSPPHSLRARSFRRRLPTKPLASTTVFHMRLFTHYYFALPTSGRETGTPQPTQTGPETSPRVARHVDY